MAQAAQGSFEDGRFVYPIRVYYEDTDAEGVVYHLNYLKYIERTGIEMLRSIGFSQKENMQSENPIALVVRHLDIDYKSFAFLDDLLFVKAKPVSVKGVRMTLNYEIYNEDKLLTTATEDIVIVDLKTKRPMRLPADLVEKLSKYM